VYRDCDDPTDGRSETPVDAHNHALAALRYLVSKLDARQMARLAGKKDGGETVDKQADERERAEKKWLSVWNEALWTRIY
jgi:hypothetical protein